MGSKADERTSLNFDRSSGMRGAALLFYAIITHEYFLYAIITALSIGVYYARAAVSISTLSLGIIAVLTVIQPGKFSELMQSKYTLALMAVVGVFVLSGLNSANTEVWLSRLSDNMPFIAIPAGIWAYRHLGVKQVAIGLSIFVGATLFSSLLLITDYLLHIQEYNALYKVGKTIPTPIIHVRYSYFLALAALCGLGLVMDRAVTPKVWRAGLMVSSIWLVACVHILAVRTGILALYGGLVILSVVYAVRKRQIKPLILTGVLISGLIVGSFVFLPSVSNKMQYMFHDLKMLRTEGVSPEYSDNLRVISILHGIDIFLAHPVVGVGIGDVGDEMEVLYNEKTPGVPPERRFPPISQYVFWLAGFGLLGTSIVIGLLLFPLLRTIGVSYTLIGIYALTGFSFFAETTIQLQLGKTVFILLVALIAGGMTSQNQKVTAMN